MATTIAVSDTTKQLLDRLKKEEALDSFDAVILDLAKERIKSPPSMFGAVPSLKWKSQDRMVLKDV
ncbi:hypothetical protein HZB01_04060 [Candidatus Woesearchaeota archaeon]|nr:hypothetical protein [Candidatus Woesearchaeota archaeon]